MSLETTHIELFPDDIAQRIEYIRLNSDSETLNIYQNELANISKFYSFGLDQDILGGRVNKSTIIMEALASISIVGLALTKKDIYFALLAFPVFGLFVKDLKLHTEDPNRHENLTLDGKRRQYIHQLRLQLSDDNKD